MDSDEEGLTNEEKAFRRQESDFTERKLNARLGLGAAPSESEEKQMKEERVRRLDSMKERAARKKKVAKLQTDISIADDDGEEADQADADQAKDLKKGVSFALADGDDPEVSYPLTEDLASSAGSAGPGQNRS